VMRKFEACLEAVVIVKNRKDMHNKLLEGVGALEWRGETKEIGSTASHQQSHQP